MSIRRGSIILLAILSFVNAEERIAYQKHWNITSESKLVFTKNQYRGNDDDYNNLIYALFDHNEAWNISKNITERNCTLVQNVEPERSCLVTLHRLSQFDIFRFGSTKAVIVGSKTFGSVECTILDFTTCKSIQVELRDIPYAFTHFIHSTYFVAYADSFELVLISDAMGNNVHYSKYHIDAKGNVVSKLAPWAMLPRVSSMYMSADLRFRAVVADGQPKAYLQFTASPLDQTLQIGLIRSDGSIKVLLADFSTDLDDLQKKVVSTAHGIIGVARPVNKRVDVWLFDQEGNLKLNTSVPHDIEVESLALRNLADGGFLLFTAGPRYHRSYHLTKVDADGKVVGSIKRRPEPNCEGKNMDLQVFENEANEYCAVFECYLHYLETESSRHRATQLDLLVKCFTDEDFSKSKTVV